jgi:hypothetical protein
MGLQANQKTSPRLVALFQLMHSKNDVVVDFFFSLHSAVCYGMTEI